MLADTPGQPRHVVVVGAGPAGFATASALRRHGYGGKLSLVGAEEHVPYDRPPLSKEFLTLGWEPDRLGLRPALDDTAVTWRLGDPAASLDTDERVLRTTGGARIEWDALVVATGLVARTLPGLSFPNVHVLRTLDDALAIQADLGTARTAVVVGAGALGCELASSLNSLGVEVTLVDSEPTVMRRQVGVDLGHRVAERHADRGTQLRLGAGIAAVEGRGRAERIVLTDGTELTADLVLVAIGAEPSTDWLADSGLDLDDGVVCDSGLRAAPGVWVAGDVARWHNRLFGRSMRVEHRFNATETGAVVAANVLGGDLHHDSVPYSWTNQAGLRLQTFGDPASAVRSEVVAGDVDDDRFAVALHDATGTVTAAVSWNLPKEGPRLRQLVLASCTRRQELADATPQAGTPAAL